MAVVTTAALYSIAYGRYAVGHFNIANMEQLLGVFRGAVEVKAPIIIAFSRPAIEYAGSDMLSGMVRAAKRMFPDAIFAVHHDHGNEETCYHAVDSGFFTSVMIDASHFPFEKNIAITRRVIERAHDRGISVEAELGVLSGDEDDFYISEREAMLTDPAQAAEFVARTGCDSLAVAVGTSHGAYKFRGEGYLRLDRLADIHQALPGFPLVLHGASAIYQYEIERINAAGGALKTDARGIDEKIIPEAVKYGITKINIGTDTRLIWTRVHREFLREKPEAYDFVEPGRIYMEELARMVANKCKALGSAGQLQEIGSKKNE